MTFRRSHLPSWSFIASRGLGQAHFLCCLDPLSKLNSNLTHQLYPDSRDRPWHHSGQVITSSVPKHILHYSNIQYFINHGAQQHGYWIHA